MFLGTGYWFGLVNEKYLHECILDRGRGLLLPYRRGRIGGRSGNCHRPDGASPARLARPAQEMDEALGKED